MATRTIPYLSSAPRFALRSVPRKLWVALCTMAEARSTRAMLMEMDGRMLSDIGVSRGAARREAARPFWDLDTGR